MGQVDRRSNIMEYMIAMIECGKSADCVLEDAIYHYSITEEEAYSIAEGCLK